MECSICCEKFNNSNRFKINCRTCDSDAVTQCRECSKRYILELPDKPSCMVCRVEWNEEMLSKNFTKTFIQKELKLHRENYLLDKQIALLPETQEYAEHLKLIKGIEKQKTLLFEQKRENDRKNRTILNSIRQLDLTIWDIRDSGKHKSTKSSFIFKCPQEDCNGFLNQSYYCGICDNKMCKHCLEIKTEDHECNTEKKETVALIKRDTKPCPGCGELIYKISGCDQMFCIKCRTAFSWKTGQIERGTVHNPEYYRWMRETGQTLGRNPLDVRYDPCGNELINYPTLLGKLRIYFPSEVKSITSRYGGRTQTNQDKPQTIKIANMHRMVGHITYLNTGFNQETNYQETNLRNLRAHFLLKQITKEDFKKKLQMQQKKMNKSKKLNDIWNVLNLVLLEYLGKIAEKTYIIIEGIKLIDDLILESEKIRKYCNRQFKKVGKIFNMTYPGITSDWIQINNWESYMKEQEKRRRRELVESM